MTAWSWLTNPPQRLLQHETDRQTGRDVENCTIKIFFDSYPSRLKTFTTIFFNNLMDRLHNNATFHSLSSPSIPSRFIGYHIPTIFFGSFKRVTQLRLYHPHRKRRIGDRGTAPQPLSPLMACRVLEAGAGAGLRGELDALGYREPLPPDALPLVRRLLHDLKEARKEERQCKEVLAETREVSVGDGVFFSRLI